MTTGPFGRSSSRAGSRPLSSTPRSAIEEDEMRARRGVYAVIFLVAALGASALVYFAQPRNGIVRAKVDIAVLTPITAEMVEVVSVSPGDAPRTPPARCPGFGFGAPLEVGQVAFALPVEPGQAVGGALAAGAR